MTITDFDETIYTKLEGGGGGGKLIFVVLWLTIFSVDELWIMIDVHSVKPKLPQSSIVYTYIEDRLKK